MADYTGSTFPKEEKTKEKKADPSPSPKSAARPKGKIMLPDEMLIHRKPAHERSGLEYEKDALETFNEKNQADYAAALEDAKRRGVNPNFVPKPKVYGQNDVLASKLITDDAAGNRVGIVLTNSTKFYYQL